MFRGGFLLPHIVIERLLVCAGLKLRIVLIYICFILNPCSLQNERGHNLTLYEVSIKHFRIMK